MVVCTDLTGYRPYIKVCLNKMGVSGYSAPYMKAAHAAKPTLNGPFKEVVGLGSYNICLGDRLGPK